MLDLTQSNKKDFSEDFFVFAAKDELKIGDVVISFSELNFPTKLANADVIDLFKGYPSIHLGVNRSGEISLVDSSELKTGDNLLSLGKLKYPILIDSQDKLRDLQKLPVNKFFVKTFEIKRDLPRMTGEELLNKAKFKNVQDQDFLYLKKSGEEGEKSEYSKLEKEESSPAVVKNLNHKDKVAQTRKEERAHFEKLQKNVVQSGAVKEEGAVLLEELFAQGNIQPSHLKDLQHVSEKIFEQNKMEPNSANILMLLKDHDEYTFRHSVDVANQLLFVLMKMNKYTEDDLRVFTLGALMHDIGKSKIPAYILNKPGPLSENEWKLMRMHPVHSAEIMLGLNMDPKQIEIGLKHHVRKDGTGYPDWVDYTDMTEVARLSVIADVFQALVTKRTYKKADTAVTALKKINLGAEDIFDSRLVSTFIKAFGVFPVGSLVRLSSRSAGFVVNNDRVSLRPKVVVCMDEGNKLMEHPEVVDLNLPENYALEIISVMDHRVFFPSNNALEHFLSLKL